MDKWTYSDAEKGKHSGIDYGSGITNIDVNTGIRYGVISLHEVSQAWCDGSEAYYPCSHCEYKDKDYEDFDCDDCEPTSWYIKDNEYTAESDSYNDIFITKSPYYTMSQLCSPCAPGAGYIMSECKEGYKSYCFGHDWFEGGKAPYTVYSVKTNEIVNL